MKLFEISMNFFFERFSRFFGVLFLNFFCELMFFELFFFDLMFFELFLNLCSLNFFFELFFCTFLSFYS